MKPSRFLLLVSLLVLFLMACQLSQAGEWLLASQLTASSVTATEQPAKPSNEPSMAPSASLPPALASQQEELLVSLYERVSPGVVAIRNLDASSLGFVFDREGHIITNYHVVQDSQRVEVDFTSGYKAYGTVIGTDLDSDIAVIKVDAPAEELHPLPLGDSDQLKVGQTVVAIGNPFGLSGTMTVGIISALGRTLDSERAAPGGAFYSAGDIIQTDAAINPGNSGGPLFNLRGEVIGVNRAIRTTNFTSTGEPLNSGIGFAISINIIRRVVPVIIQTGHYDYPYLGISALPELNLMAIEALGLKNFTGAYVTDMTPGGPADKAGLRGGDRPTSIEGLQAGGDLIIAIDGHEVKRFDDLLRYLINNKSPGDTVVLTVLRGDEKVDITVQLGKRP
uniref:2-alkenal reductase n=1 Tax=uncultured Chloroflexota bacterium TaxID=166587 RepID=H5SF22_9CHLR|nr:2-alkenal reductase [uncultured Chloroflexota bacterium]